MRCFTMSYQFIEVRKAESTDISTTVVRDLRLKFPSMCSSLSTCEMLPPANKNKTTAMDALPT